MQNENQPTQYCNIDRKESQIRYIFGFLLGIMALVMAIIYFSTSQIAYLPIIAVLIFSAVLNYWQGKNRFCLAYAIGGIEKRGDATVKNTLNNAKQQLIQSSQGLIISLGGSLLICLALFIFRNLL